ERDVVVEVVGLGFGASAAGFGATAAFCARGGTAARRVEFDIAAAAPATTAFTRTQELHFLGDDLGRVAILAFLVLPFARLQPAFDIDRTAFLQILAGDLGQPVVEHDAVPFGLFLLFAGRLVLPLARCRDGDVADRRSARCVTRFRITAEIADDDHLV